MEVKIRKGNVLITLPMEEPRLSASGKNRVVASSYGVRNSTARVDGKIVRVTANAFIDADDKRAQKRAKPQKP
jgi:hypothetical protein